VNQYFITQSKVGYYSSLLKTAEVQSDKSRHGRLRNFFFRGGRVPLVMESHGILGRPFSGPGKSWKIAKVMENDDNVMDFLLLH